MRVFVTGGTGFVGGAIVRALVDQGHEVLVLSRSPGKGDAEGTGAELVIGDPAAPGPWQDRCATADAVVNLAGASIFQRWSDEVKKQVMDSRIMTTRHVVEALTRTKNPDRLLLNASAVGYYGARGDEILDENAPPGDDFLARVCLNWESEAAKATAADVRVAVMRFGIVLDAGGGAIEQMLRVFRWGLGGRLGDGSQWFSWVHRRDLVNAALFLLNQPKAHGPFNFTAPNPVTNATLTKALGRALNRPTFLVVPGPVLKVIMGEFGQVVLTGQRVLPKKLEARGFNFDFPHLDPALEDIVSRA